MCHLLFTWAWKVASTWFPTSQSFRLRHFQLWQANVPFSKTTPFVSTVTKFLHLSLLASLLHLISISQSSNLPSLTPRQSHPFNRTLIYVTEPWLSRKNFVFSTTSISFSANPRPQDAKRQLSATQELQCLPAGSFRATCPSQRFPKLLRSQKRHNKEVMTKAAKQPLCPVTNANVIPWSGWSSLTRLVHALRLWKLNELRCWNG